MLPPLVEFSNGVIVLASFNSTRGGIINISNIISGLSTLWNIYTLRINLLEEFVNSLSFEHMFVFSKFTGVFTVNLSEDWSFTGGFTSS
jgi:hypothetical protein